MASNRAKLETTEYKARLYTFSQRLKEEREKLGLTQGALATCAGLSGHAVISRWEAVANPDRNGEYVSAGAVSRELPDVNDLLNLCAVFGCDIDYLVGIQELPTKAATDILGQIGVEGKATMRLGEWLILARLWEKHVALTIKIGELEQSFRRTRNDTPEEAVAEQLQAKDELDALEKEMQELTDPGEGYLKPPAWLALIRCMDAWQRLSVLNALITTENGEKTLDDVAGYFYLGESAEGDIRPGNGSPQRKLSKEDIEKIKLMNIQENLSAARKEAKKGGGTNGAKN